MPPHTKMTMSKGGSSSDPLHNPRKRPATQSPPRKRSKQPATSFSPCHDVVSLERFQRIFLRHSIITKRSINAETLQTAQLTEHLEGRRLMSFILVTWPVQEEAIRIFYANMFDINNEAFLFWTMVCNTPVEVSPTILSRIFGVPLPPTPLAYPIHHLTLE